MQQWVSNFTSNIKPPHEHLDDADRRSKYVIEKLEGIIDEEDGIEITRVFIGGSNATHTTIKKNEDNEFDIDVHVYLTGDNVESMHLRSFLRRKLIEIYPNKDESDFETTKSSVKVEFRGGIKMNMDVVPVVHDKTQEGYRGYIPRPNGEQLWTNVPKHIEWVRSKTKISNPPVKFNKMVRLMKWWKNYQKINVNSFSTMILTGYSFDNTTFSSNWNEALQQVFNYFHTSWNTIPNLGTAARVRDPINSENNAANSWTSAARDKFTSKANEAEDYINRANSEFQAGDKIEAMQYLTLVFGPEISKSI